MKGKYKPEERAQMTLGLDALMRELSTNLSARESLLAYAQSKPNIIADVDQLRAASGDAEEMLDAVARRLGIEGHGAAYGEIPDWLQLSIFDILLMWMNAEARTCLHDPDPSRPKPVFTAAWRPGLVVCRDCIHLIITPRRGSEADNTCDACGRFIPEGLISRVVKFGAMTYMYGACDECNTPDDAPLSGRE